MSADRQVYNLKVDSSARNHIAERDTVVVVADDAGLHVKTRDR
jgi:hypothetical protein